MGFKEETDIEVSRQRSFHSLPPIYAPSLLFSHGKNFRDQTLCTLCDGLNHDRRIPEMRHMRCMSSCFGWLVLIGYSSTECCLFDPISLAKISLPPLPDGIFQFGTLTSAPSGLNSIVVFICKTKMSLLFCRVGEEKWREHKLVPQKKTPKSMQGSINTVCCEGKVFLLFSLQVASVEFHDTFASVEFHETNEPEISIPESTSTITFYLESCGEIFNVIAINLGLSDNIFRKVDVFKLDISIMEWVKVENLGDRIFLLGKNSASVSATEIGMKGNCIYFTVDRCTWLYRFDMDYETITNTLPCPNKFSHWDGPYWVVPNCKFKGKELAKLEDNSNSEYEANKETSNWNDLRPELLELIVRCLCMGDYFRFRLTCKSWFSTQPLQSNPLCIPDKSESRQLPWFISLVGNTGVCQFHHPIYSDIHIVNIPEVAGAIVRHAKYGWLLMSLGKASIFFLNPFTRETIMLPFPDDDLNGCYGFSSISFSCPPTSADCIVLGHIEDMQSNRILVYCKDDNTWFPFWLDNEGPYPFVTSYCNPVFHDDVFYCLGKDGQLGVFDPSEEIDSVWKVHPNTIIPALRASKVSLFGSSARSFMVECNDEIISVFVGSAGRPVTVFKLDRSEEWKWVEVKSLDGKTIFLSHTTSIMVPASLKGVEDRIYLPRSQREGNIYYSLRSGSYHCLGNKGSCEDWTNTAESWNCTWFQTS